MSKIENRIIKVLDSNGNFKEDRELEKNLQIEVTDNSYHILHFVLEAERWNRRQGTRKTKTISEVSGGGKKPYKQKGTGYARQGSIRAPQFKGGATVFGPQPQEFYKKVNSKLRKLAYKILLNIKSKNNQLYIIDDLKLEKYSTKQIFSVLNNAKLIPSNTISFIFNDSEPYLYKSANNIPYLEMVSSLRPKIPEMYNNSILFFTKQAYEDFKKIVGE